MGIGARTLGDPTLELPEGRPVVDDSCHLVSEDTGCEWSPTCLACPMPVCKHDLPLNVARVVQTRKRDLYIQSLRREGVSVDEIALFLGIGRRTVLRICERTKKRLTGLARDWLAAEEVQLCPPLRLPLLGS